MFVSKAISISEEVFSYSEINNTIEEVLKSAKKDITNCKNCFAKKMENLNDIEKQKNQYYINLKNTVDLLSKNDE